MIRRSTITMASQHKLPTNLLNSVSHHLGHMGSMPHISKTTNDIDNNGNITNANNTAATTTSSSRQDSTKIMELEMKLDDVKHQQASLLKKHQIETTRLTSTINQQQKVISENDQKYKKMQFKFMQSKVHLVTSLAYEDRIKIELVEKEVQMKEISAALRITVLQTKAAIRQQQKLTDAIHAQEKSHLKAISQLHLHNQLSISKASQKEKKLKEHSDISSTELETLHINHRELQDALTQMERNYTKSKTVNSEQASELIELREHVNKVEEERNVKSQELKDLHVTHISEKSRLESALNVTKTELETSNHGKYIQRKKWRSGTHEWTKANCIVFSC